MTHRRGWTLLVVGASLVAVPALLVFWQASQPGGGAGAEPLGRSLYEGYDAVRERTSGLAQEARDRAEPPAARKRQESPPPATLGRQFATYEVDPADFNKPLSPFNVYLDLRVRGGPRQDTYVTVVAQHGRPVDFASGTWQQGQIRPYTYTWQLRDKTGDVTNEWLAHFLENRDQTYHTIVRLPLEDLNRSHLLLYFERIDQNPIPEHMTFDVDLSGVDWRRIDPGHKWRWRDGKLTKD